VYAKGLAVRFQLTLLGAKQPLTLGERPNCEQLKLFGASCIYTCNLGLQVAGPRNVKNHHQVTNRDDMSPAGVEVPRDKRQAHWQTSTADDQRQLQMIAMADSDSG